jgi:hypothetical protein
MRIRLAVLSVMLCGLASQTASANSLNGTHPWPGSPPASVRVPVIGWSTRSSRAIPLDEGRTSGLRLDKSAGWSNLSFPIQEQVSGIFIDVQGKVQFRYAEVSFADGGIESIDLRLATRGRGLFELTTFDKTREVTQVRLVARARTRNAGVDCKRGVPIAPMAGDDGQPATH